MSDNMLTVGYMAKLATPVPDMAGAGQIRDRLDAVGLDLNYQGTMVILTTNTIPLSNAYGLRYHPESRTIRNDMIVRCSQAGVSVEPDSITPFTDIWYNGTDSNHSDSDVAVLDEALRKAMAGFAPNGKT